MPAAEHVIDAALVRALLEAQHPDLAAYEIELVGEGWDNAVFRLGAHFVARLPRREASAALIENEIRWLPELCARLPLPVPSVEHVGQPACGYPWRWYVSRWLPGEVAARCPPVDQDAAARTLGAFLAALHRPAPVDAPRNPFRGIPLKARAERVEGHLEALRTELAEPTVSRLRSLWRELSLAAAYQQAPRWLHGDLHPANVLVQEGVIAGVLDFGDVCAGDPACDLAVGWMMFSASGRAAFRRAYPSADRPMWLRARAWALALGLATMAEGAGHPEMQRVARDTLRNIAAATDG